MLSWTSEASQQSTVVEGLGGVVSKSLASKAWKAAQKLAITPRRPVKRGGAGDGTAKRQSQQESKTKLPCYWCNKTGHAGKFCPEKLSGKPFNPQSRAASWPDNRVAAVQKPKQPKLKVEKPKPKK